MDAARRTWTLAEPIHALTYFAPQARAATEAVGLRGFWRGYFATRLAPLGAVDAPVATALFFGFSPAMVARAVPSVWELAAPALVLQARLDGMDDLLRTTWASHEDAIARAAELLHSALAGAAVSGRALFAANHALPWPAEPHLAVWHGCTLLREHRGDGHVAALTAAGLDGCEALVTHTATGVVDPAALQSARGWTDAEWQAAHDRLTARGWLDGDVLTAAGAAVRDAVEHATDVAAARALTGLTDAERSDLDAALGELCEPVVAAGVLPYPNPMGVRDLIEVSS